MELTIISGLSGAGKSNVASIMEDLGYFVVDNMPAALIPRFAELCMAGQAKYEKAAVVIDIRGGQTFEGLFAALGGQAAPFTLSPPTGPERLPGCGGPPENPVYRRRPAH